ncbi:MAG: hypothetical protein HXY34_09600 [Candidatus Thorarchaeota archaeon]|nr:hypothetical protein [Candidatus Thorarchaeota archaeon]
MNETVVRSRSALLRQYYGAAQLGWFHPRSLHWAKVVTEDGFWRWIRSDSGVRRRLLKKPPVHVYQTVLRFKTDGPPRGWRSTGYLLGGPVLFETDLFDKSEPLSVWKVVDSIHIIDGLVDLMRDRGDYRPDCITYSGFRGVHVMFSQSTTPKSFITLEGQDSRPRDLRNFVRSRKHMARSVGCWCREWDWKVSADIWRVARVPWSIHGSSALRAIPLKPRSTPSSVTRQLREASPFSFTSSIHVRTKRHIPPFVFVDGETYGPYGKGWTTRLPIAVALHLIWQDLARPREAGPRRTSTWFERGWQVLFHASAEARHEHDMSAGRSSG